MIVNNKFKWGITMKWLSKSSKVIQVYNVERNFINISPFFCSLVSQLLFLVLLLVFFFYNPLYSFFLFSLYLFYYSIRVVYFLSQSVSFMSKITLILLIHYNLNLRWSIGISPCLPPGLVRLWRGYTHKKTIWNFLYVYNIQSITIPFTSFSISIDFLAVSIQNGMTESKQME